jgi:hypothetical protein
LHSKRSPGAKQPERSTSIPDVQTFGENACHPEPIRFAEFTLSEANGLRGNSARASHGSLLSKCLPDVRLEAQPLIARAEPQSAPGLTRSG